jgi:hypothetical protein
MRMITPDDLMQKTRIRITDEMPAEAVSDSPLGKRNSGTNFVVVVLIHCEDRPINHNHLAYTSPDTENSGSNKKLA